MRILSNFLLLSVLCFCISSFVAFAAEDPYADDKNDPNMQPGFDPLHAHTQVRDGMTADEVRLAGHLAHYVLASVLRFPSMAEAEAKLADLKEGKTNFKKLAENLNNYWILKGATKQTSGEVGLVTYHDVPKKLAPLLFDIRQPEAEEKSINLLGPVADDDGVWVGAAFKRYRKQFFTDAWWELERFCTQTKMKTTDMLQLIENQDRLWQMAFMIWPEEHVSFKRLKIRQIRADFKKIGTDDPSTRMPPPKKKLAPHVHAHNINERKRFFERVDPKIIAEHPEIYAMSYDEIRAHGWHPEDAAVQRAKEKYASESKSKSQQSQEIDPSKIAN